MTSAPNFHGKKEHMRSNISSSVSDLRSFGKRLMMIVGAVVLLGGCATGIKDTSRSFNTVVIDAGHGGHDYGARSRWGGQEKNNALSVAQRLDSKLRAAGFKTVMTRKGDYFVTLNDRAKISNRQSNAIFVSIHFNHSPKKRISGSEVYYKSPVSQAMARNILSQIDALPSSHARYTKTANFRVLRLNRYPAVLVECGYMSNRSEGRLSASTQHHERLASAIARALSQQRGRTFPEPTIVEAAPPASVPKPVAKAR